jgi:transposase
MVELGTRGAIERAPVGHSPPTAARAVFLPGLFKMHFSCFASVKMGQIEVKRSLWLSWYELPFK